MSRAFRNVMTRTGQELGLTLDTDTLRQSLENAQSEDFVQLEDDAWMIAERRTSYMENIHRGLKNYPWLISEQEMDTLLAPSLKYPVSGEELNRKSSMGFGVNRDDMRGNFLNNHTPAGAEFGAAKRKAVCQGGAGGYLPSAENAADIGNDDTRLDAFIRYK